MSWSIFENSYILNNSPHSPALQCMTYLSNSWKANDNNLTHYTIISCYNIIPVLATRFLYQEGTSDYKCQIDITSITCDCISQVDWMWYQSWPPDASTRGVYLSWLCLTVNVKLTLHLTVNVKVTWCSTALHH